MRILPLIIAAGLSATAALAGDATRSWGTGGGANSSSAYESAAVNQMNGQIAQQSTIGRDIINIGRSVSSCGSCTYYQVTGSANNVSGNSSSGANSGTISSTGNFNN